jgi:hypothetical protein
MGEADFLTPADLDALGASDTLDSVAMVRPDDVTFTVSESGRATVIAAEFRGTMWCYTLQLGNGSSVRSTRSHLDRVAVGTRVDPALLPGHEPVPISD